MRFTVFGGTGFIGRRLVQHLREQGEEVFVPARDARDAFGADLGHVIYAIGLTGDFRSRPFDTVAAHVGVLADLLRRCSFESWLYLSSTRVYGGLPPGTPAAEDAALKVAPGADSIYDLSKLCGEALCLAQPSTRIRVARLSNVFAVEQNAHTFLSAVLAELLRQGRVVIREAPQSAKDYVALDDILPLLRSIAQEGRQRIYNVASGDNLDHLELAGELSRITGAEVVFEPGAPLRAFPRIDVRRLVEEFGQAPAGLRGRLERLLAAHPLRAR